jgi:hypothetical protein
MPASSKECALSELLILIYYDKSVQHFSSAVHFLLHFERIPADTPEVMITGRPPKGSNYVERIRVTYRLRPEMVEAIKKNARQREISRTAYVELAVQELLKTEDEHPKRHTAKSARHG